MSDDAKFLRTAQTAAPISTRATRRIGRRIGCLCSEWGRCVPAKMLDGRIVPLAGYAKKGIYKHP